MNSTTWYIARSAGIVAYLLLSSSVVVGVLMSAKAKLSWPCFAVEETHRFIAILTGVFIVIHGGSLLLDTVVPTSITQLLIPFGTSYRPFAVGLGVVAAELLAAVAITNALRGRIPYRVWRRVHYLTIAVWLASTAHGLLAGTDRQDAWFIALVSVSASSVALAFLFRFARATELPAIAMLSITTVVAVLGLAFTPQPASRPAAQAAAAAVVPSAYNHTVAARIVSQSGDPLVSVVGTAGAAALRADLLVLDGVVQQTSFQLRFPSGAVCQGTLDSVQNTGITGSCGAHHFTLPWTVGDNKQVAGQLRLS